MVGIGTVRPCRPTFVQLERKKAGIQRQKEEWPMLLNCPGERPQRDGKKYPSLKLAVSLMLFILNPDYAPFCYCSPRNAPASNAFPFLLQLVWVRFWLWQAIFLPWRDQFLFARDTLPHHFQGSEDPEWETAYDRSRKIAKRQATDSRQIRKIRITKN